MNTSEIILTILGTGGFTTIAVKTFLETTIKESIGTAYKKQLEEHKFLLKNSEKVFQYKLDASKSLYKVLHEITPKKSNPDMDFYEACEEIASSFLSHENALDDFLCEYQATLSPEILQRVHAAVAACSDGRFEFYFDSSVDDIVCSSYGIAKAELLYKVISEAVEILRAEVYEMITIPKYELEQPMKQPHWLLSNWSCIIKKLSRP